MNEKEISRLLHDLRAPLVRARSYAKLMENSSAEDAKVYLLEVQKALDDLDTRLSALDFSS